MPVSEIQISSDDFEHVEWQSLVEGVEPQDCRVFHNLLMQRAAEAGEESDAPAERVYLLLGAATGLMLQAESRDEPLTPARQSADGRRSPAVEDFTAEQLSVIRELVPTVPSAELRARLADLVWMGLRKGSYHTAAIAIDAYLEASAHFTDDEAHAVWERLQRAAMLARSLGRDSEPVGKVRERIEERLAPLTTDDQGWLRAQLMESLRSFPDIDVPRYMQLAEDAARRADANGHTAESRRYWQLAADWALDSDDALAHHNFLLAAAETHVAEADAVERGPHVSHLRIARHLEEAIASFGKMQGTEERVMGLRRRMQQHQRASVEEMEEFSSPPVDIGRLIENAREKVAGKPLHEALYIMCLLHQPDKAARLRAQAEENAKNSLAALMRQTVLDARGRVKMVLASPFANDPSEVEKSIESMMFDILGISHDLAVHTCVEPARFQIQLEHSVRESDFFRLVRASGFVPPEHELQYAKGLYAGFIGDFILAAHVLIPQLENSLRYVLEQAGEITSYITDTGEEAERVLSGLLKHQKLQEILGEDMLYDLRSLLERHGDNLRNELAHGLTSDSAFYHSRYRYLWWVILRLCLAPLIHAWSTEWQGEHARAGVSEDSEGGDEG